MAGTIATNRAAAEERIFATFGQAFERNMGALASVSMPEARKELGASRLALEHAVMKAAVLNNAPTTAIAGKRSAARPAPTALAITIRRTTQ